MEHLMKKWRSCTIIFMENCSKLDWQSLLYIRREILVLLLNCPSKKTFEQIGYKFRKNIPIKLFRGCFIYWSNLKSARKLCDKQSHFLVAFMKTLQCFEENHENKLLLNCAKLTPTDTENSKKMNLHGASLLVQEILQFNKPIKMVNSLLNTDPEKLSNLLSDPRGSHITDAFMLRFVFFVLIKSGSSHKTIDFFSFC